MAGIRLKPARRQAFSSLESNPSQQSSELSISVCSDESEEIKNQGHDQQKETRLLIEEENQNQLEYEDASILVVDDCLYN